jgi:hypothetical protein
MSLTAMDAPKPMRQPASTEKNGPPNHGPIGGILGLPPPTNLANHTPPRIGPTGSTRIRTVPNQSGGGSKRLTLLQASILVAPIAGAESCPKIHRTTHQSERPASGNARTNFWEEDGRPEGREQEYWEPAEVNDS